MHGTKYAEISWSWAVKDTEHLEISVSFIHVLEDIAWRIVGKFLFEYISGRNSSTQHPADEMDWYFAQRFYWHWYLIIRARIMLTPRRIVHIKFECSMILTLNSTGCAWSWHPTVQTQIARFMWPTWGPPGSCRPQVGPMLAPWTLLSGRAHLTFACRSNLYLLTSNCRLLPHIKWRSGPGGTHSLTLDTNCHFNCVVHGNGGAPLNLIRSSQINTERHFMWSSK